MNNEFGTRVLTSPVASFEMPIVPCEMVMWAYVVCLKYAVAFSFFYVAAVEITRVGIEVRR